MKITLEGMKREGRESTPMKVARLKAKSLRPFLKITQPFSFLLFPIQFGFIISVSSTHFLLQSKTTNYVVDHTLNSFKNLLLHSHLTKRENIESEDAS